MHHTNRKLRAQAILLGYALRDLAKLCQISQPAFSLILTGQRPLTAKRLFILAAALQMEPRELWDLIPHENIDDYLKSVPQNQRKAAE